MSPDQNTKLIIFSADPLSIEVYDDWKAIHSETDQKNPLQLSFVVTSSKIVAAVTIGTVPKLMSYANNFESNLEAQRQGASRESAAFRNSRSLKPDNPLSAVAEAMLQTAKAKFKEADSRLTFIVRQFMSLKLGHLQLAVFPRSMEDLEMAQFVARDIRARLARLVATDFCPGQRDLHLSFASMNISKFTYNQSLNAPLPDQDQCRTWLEGFVKGALEATIVGLPSMKMHMYSEENDDDVTRNLLYDFHSTFVRQGLKDVDDIYITLNVALYSWLTFLRKNMTREMDQVRAAAEWRTSLIPGVGSLAVVEEQQHASDNFVPVESVPFPTPRIPPSGACKVPKHKTIKYMPRERSIERLTMRQLGEATPDVMHPFFMKKAGFNLEDALPQYINEYATTPLEEIMEVLLKIYSRQLNPEKQAEGHKT